MSNRRREIDPLKDWWRKASSTSQPRVLLFPVVHSLSRQVRQTALASHDASLYKRANLQTPSEVALQSMNAGSVIQTSMLEWIQETLVKPTMSQPIDPCFIWIQTLPRKGTTSTEFDISTMKGSYVIDLTRSPYNWLDDDDDDDDDGDTVGANDGIHTTVNNSDNQHLHQVSCSMNLQDLTACINTGLQLICNSTQTQHRIPILIQSCTPLIHRHGVNKLLQWWSHTLPRQVAQDYTDHSFLFMACLTGENLTHDQLADLFREDMGSTIGKSWIDWPVWVRPGIREPEARIRVDLALQYVQSKSCYQVRIAEDSQHNEDVAEEPVPVVRPSNPLVQARPASRTKKTVLQIQDDEPPTRPLQSTEQNTPLVMVEDHDPEYDDYDEEDPDDDLDL
jgi:hypothetical protein